MTISQGDIVQSNGRIATIQNDRRRYIEFEKGLVLDVDGPDIIVNPVGMRARVTCRADDLHIAQEAEQPEPEPQQQARPKPKPEPEAKPSLKLIKPEKKKPALKRSAKKPAARRKRPNS